MSNRVDGGGGIRAAASPCVIAVRDGLGWCSRHDSAWPIDRLACDVRVISERPAEGVVSGFPGTKGSVRLREAAELAVFAYDTHPNPDETLAGVGFAVEKLRAALSQEPSHDRDSA